MTSKRSLKLNLKSIILLKGMSGDKSSLYAKIGWAIVILGILLRVYVYFFVPTYLTYDEAVAFQLYDKYGPLEILSPQRGSYVGCMQYPFIFLIISKYLVSFFGPHLYILRLVPFLSGILALVLFNKLKDLFLPPLPGLMAIFLMATNWRTMFYGMLAKPYSCDLLITIVLLLLFHNIRSSKDINRNKFALYSLAGIISIWISNPSIFILASGIIALGFSGVSNAGKGRFNKEIFLMSLLWGLSFLINYWVRLRVYTFDDSHLSQTWESLTFLDRGVWSSISLACNLSLGMFRYILNMTPFLGLFFLIMGFIWFYRHKRYDFLIMILPLVLTMAAAMMDKYVFFKRLLLFLLPVLYIAICRGCWYAFSLTRSKIYRFIVLALCAFMIISPLKYIERGLSRSPIRDGIIPKFEHAFENFKEGDGFYLSSDLRLHFLYFNKTHQIPEELFIVSRNSTEDSVASKEIDALRKFKRIWFLVQRDDSTYSIYIRQRLEGVGALKETQNGHRGNLYLYELFPSVEK